MLRTHRAETGAIMLESDLRLWRGGDSERAVVGSIQLRKAHLRDLAQARRHGHGQ